MSREFGHADRVILAGFSVEVWHLAKAQSMSICGIVEPKINMALPKSVSLFDCDEEAILAPRPTGVLNAIDEIGRKVEVDKLYSRSGIEPVYLISGEICTSSKYDPGLIMQANSVVSSDVIIGRCVKINTSATVTHNVSIGDYSIIAPGAVILGRVSIGKRVYVGANATVLPDLTIEDGSVIGAGAVVTKSIPANSTVAGVPAKRIL